MKTFFDLIDRPRTRGPTQHRLKLLSGAPSVPQFFCLEKLRNLLTESVPKRGPYVAGLALNPIRATFENYRKIRAVADDVVDEQAAPARDRLDRLDRPLRDPRALIGGLHERAQRMQLDLIKHEIDAAHEPRRESPIGPDRVLLRMTQKR
jgi:hypothetical protein